VLVAGHPGCRERVLGVVTQMRLPPKMRVWAIRADDDKVARVTLRLDTVDTNTGKPTQLSQDVDVDGYDGARAIAFRIWMGCRSMMIHEVDEWVTLDGVMLNDPHAPGSVL
jgi:hypothetical protein